MTPITRLPVALRIGVAVALTGLTLAGCGGSSANPSAPAGGAAPGAGAVGPQVLPVATNPIKNTSTVQALKIDSVLVENNTDPTTSKVVSDHLELALSNSGSTPLTGLEVFYTITDTKTKGSESYYAKLPSSFTIPAGGKRTVNFDGTGAPDHFPVNKFSLYYQSKNALDISVTVSAANAAVQTATAKKAAGGAEGGD